MKKSQSSKAEAARKRVLRTGTVQARSARSALELRTAARSTVVASAIKPELKLDAVHAKATAATKLLHRG